jgi:hypothetical protein
MSSSSSLVRSEMAVLTAPSRVRRASAWAARARADASGRRGTLQCSEDLHMQLIGRGRRARARSPAAGLEVMSLLYVLALLSDAAGTLEGGICSRKR